MSISLSAEQQRYVDELIQSGKFRSVDEVISEALDGLRKRDATPPLDPETGVDLQELRDALQTAHAQLERGEARELTLEDVVRIVEARGQSAT
ncbi:MAG: type II toxin-antitoxin system ParD family antitoxin [Phycisphaerae bacterium]